MAGHQDIEFAGLTDVGVRRSHNQDSYAILPATDKIQWWRRGAVFLVADGMGAHAVGELASKLAADSIPHLYSKHANEGPVSALRRAFIEANTNIHTRGQQNRDFEGMGTTTTALVLRPEGAWVGHVGDSRVYRVRNGKLDQLSFDHSLVWEMARRQKCKPEKLQGIPSNVIVRSLGPEPLVQVDVEGPHPIEPGDVFVICSDGLSGPVSDQEIATVASLLPPAEASRLLIDLANLYGGPDNITVIVVKIRDLDDDENSEDSDSWFDVERATKPKKDWYERLNWPLISVNSGIVFAILAILCFSLQLPGPGLLSFLMATASIFLGVGFIIYHYRKNKQKRVVPTNSKPPQIYRELECPIDMALLEKLNRVETALEERIRSYGWTVDWSRYQELKKASTVAMEADNRVLAFQHSCRALRSLTEMLQKQRSKAEVFQPHWENKAAKNGG